MRASFHRFSRSRGFGLLEIILVFAVILGAGAVVFEVYKSAQASAQASDADDRLNTLVGNLRATVGVNHDYSSLADAYSTSSAFNTAGAATLLQKIYTVSGTNNTATAPDGSSITVNAWRDSFTVGRPDGSMFLITISHIPPDSCAKFLAAVVGNGSAFSGVAITGPSSNSYSWIALQNTAAATQQGYTHNMASPSFGDYAAQCDFQAQFNGSAAIMLVGS